MNDSERARALAERYWDKLLELEPLLATQVGDERFDDRLPDPSDEGIARREAENRAALEELAGIDRAGLDVTLRTTLDILEACALRDLASIEHRLDRLQVVSHLWGPGQLLAELGTMQRADSPERLERYLARLRSMPEYLRAVEAVASDGVKTRVTAPRVVAERAAGQVERLLAVPVEESPSMIALPDDDVAGRERVAEALREVVMPAYESHLAALRDYLPHATETVGLCDLPNGEAMYAAEILSWTTLPLAAQEIHDLGVADLGKILEERHEIGTDLGFASAEDAITAHTASGNNTAPSQEALVHLAEEQVQRGWDAAPRYFGHLPSTNCEVRAVEEFREEDMPGAWYQPPSEDGTRIGIYYVNTYDLENRPIHHLATTTYHEANPGHHFQITIEQELTDRPMLRRFGGILAGSATVEGWGLYSERLADEMGLFSDEYERIGMLEAQAWRAARLVVDTGIHALGWDRERAVAALARAAVPHTDAEIETDRYITMPGQALSYKIGQIEIERWRREAEERERDTFRLKDFHDRVLALGSLPLPAMQRELSP